MMTKAFSAAAALALVLPLTVSTVSFAQTARGPAVNGGGAGARGAVGGAGGTFAGRGAAVNAGGTAFANRGAIVGGSGARFNGARAAPVSGAAVPAGVTGGNFTGGGSAGRYYDGDRYRHRNGGFWPGFAAGAAVGSYAYYGGPYYDPYYYDDDYYYDAGPSVTVGVDGGVDSVASCAQRFRSYDPASGTYLGYDGLRQPCP